MLSKEAGMLPVARTMTKPLVKTTVPVNAGNNFDPNPEFLRTNPVYRKFGLKRGTLYNLHRDGKIKSVLLRSRGQKSGVRLWCVESIRSFIQQSMQNQEAV